MKTTIVLNGAIISESTRFFGENRERPDIVKINFFNHLRNALLYPDTFVFIGAAGVENAEEWLAFQSKRLGVKLTGEFELICDGKLITAFSTPENEFEKWWKDEGKKVWLGTDSIKEVAKKSWEAGRKFK